MIDTLNYRAAQLEAADAKLIYRMDPVRGGLNNRFGPQHIGDDEYSDGLNVDLTDPTRPSGRDGYLVLGDSAAEMIQGLDAGLVSKRIAGFAGFDPSKAVSPSNKFLIICINDGASGRTYFRTDVSIAGMWAECLPQYACKNDDVVIFQANDSLILVSQEPTVNVFGVDNSGATTDGGNADDTNVALGSPPRDSIDGFYAYNRAWLLTRSNTLCYSKLQPSAAGIGSQWSRTGTYSGAVDGTDGGRFILSPNVGSRAVASRPHVNGSIICYFNRCIEGISGFDTVDVFSDPQTNAFRRVVSSAYGCGARDTLVTAGSDHLFMDQYGSIRSLAQTVNAELNGVTALPLSEKIRGFLPGRMNTLYMSKCRAVIVEQRLLIAFPLDSSTECNGVAVYNLAFGLWEGVWKLARPVSKWALSNLRLGGADELWFADSGSTAEGPLARVYRMFPGTYTDDGQPITFEYVTKAYHFGTPEAEKLFPKLELGMIGTQGTRVFLETQFGESGVFSTSADLFSIPASGTSSWPLVFPLVFPLTAVADALFHHVWELDEFLNQGSSRYARFKVRATAAGGGQFKLAEYFLSAKLLQRKELE